MGFLVLSLWRQKEMSMKNLKEILGKDKGLLFYVKPQKAKKFLLYAKTNGCRWVNGQQISIGEDYCGHFMAIDQNLRIGYVSAMCWHYGDSSLKKLNF